MKLIAKRATAFAWGIVVAVAMCVGGQAASGAEATIKTEDKTPPAPRVEDVPLKESVTQYGITWTFEKPAQVGQFITGDYWVVGPVTVVSVRPAPAGGRNGSMVNPKAGPQQAYDDRLQHYKAGQLAAFPLQLAPGQSLVSTESLGKSGDSSPEAIGTWTRRNLLRTAAVLTCAREPPPADAFRPAYVGETKVIWRASQLKKELLPKLAAPAGVKLPDLKLHERYLQRIWLDTLPRWTSGAMHPVENMPDYPREMTQIVADVGLLLLLEDPDKEREPLLRLFVQMGIDYYGIAQSDNQLWQDNGGHGSGRKWPIVFAGFMLGDEKMMHVKVASAEDYQTYYGNCWTGAKVCWGGFHAFDVKQDHEEKPPSAWTADGRGKAGDPSKGSVSNAKLEAYRRSCTSHVWVGEALAVRLLGLEKAWGHPAFFDYVDRWMFEDDAEFSRTIVEACDPYFGKNIGFRQQTIKDPFVEALWTKYRPTLGPTDGWKKEHMN